MARNTIYYAFALPPATGGDFVSIEHVAGLRKLGFDAKVFYGASDNGHAQFPVPVARLGTVFQPDDVVVVGENHSFAPLASIPCIKVMNNQNPYFTFSGFETVAALNAFPLSHILVPSDFCAAKLSAMGVTRPLLRVRPMLADYFAPAPKRLAIAYAPAKRPVEATFLKGYFRALVPEYAHLPWLPLSGLTRQACAAAMGECAVYAALPWLEGLGLMNLEAMASGCQVVGYVAHGGAEYAMAENGDWIAEGEHEEFVAGLRAACRRHEAGEGAARIAAGRVTAQQFSRANFERELEAAWTSILGGQAGLYRL